MNSDYIKLQKNMDAFRRMYMEFIVNIYNDIMTYQDYSDAIRIWLLHKNEYYKNKLERHYDAINWLINDSIDSLCFRVLELEHLTQEDIINSISKKFYANKKFIKFFKSYSLHILKG